MANHQVLHWHHDLAAQITSAPCELHPQASCCTCLQCDVLCMGVPCNPYSVQRSARFKEGSLEEHPLSSHTTRDVWQMLKVYNPPTAFMEQTAGFGLATSVSDPVTPLSRPGGFVKTARPTRLGC